jgi:hypothetical protein
MLAVRAGVPLEVLRDTTQPFPIGITDRGPSCRVAARSR